MATNSNQSVIEGYSVIEKSPGNRLMIFSKRCDEFKVEFLIIFRLSTVVIQTYFTEFKSGSFLAWINLSLWDNQRELIFAEARDHSQSFLVDLVNSPIFKNIYFRDTAPSSNARKVPVGGETIEKCLRSPGVEPR